MTPRSKSGLISQSGFIGSEFDDYSNTALTSTGRLSSIASSFFSFAPINQRNHDSNSLTMADWEDPIVNIRGFFIGQQFGPIRKYPKEKLRVLLLRDDEIDVGTKKQYQFDEIEHPEITPEVLQNHGSCASLENFRMASAASGTQRLVTSLGLSSITSSEIHIHLGDGHEDFSNHHCF